MDTLFVFILRDSIATNVVNVVDSCQHCVKEAETNCNDVTIVGIICIALVLVVLLAAIGLYWWQKFKYLQSADDKKYSHEKEKADSENSRREKEYQHEKERSEREDARRDKEYQREKEKTDYQKAAEFFNQLCNASRSSEGDVDKDILNILLNSFSKLQKENSCSDEEKKQKENHSDKNDKKDNK